MEIFEESVLSDGEPWTVVPPMVILIQHSHKGLTDFDLEAG